MNGLRDLDCRESCGRYVGGDALDSSAVECPGIRRTDSRTVLKTGLTPSASGSAYLELEPSSHSNGGRTSSATPRSGLKLTCTVHGPRPLPRSAPFSPQLLLSTRIKFAPFATRQRKGAIPEVSERDLAAHLESALRGVIIADRWPKSGVDVVITVLEAEEEAWAGQGTGRSDGWSIMTLLSGCITVASAAVADAGIDCADLVTGGVAALVGQASGPARLVLDPCPSDHVEIHGICVVGYSQSRDEIVELWAQGSGLSSAELAADRVGCDALVDNAVEAACAARLVLVEALRESTEAKLRLLQSPLGS